MKLSKYLADYIEHELEEGYIPAIEGHVDAHLIQQAIKAFVSTEDKKLLVIDEAGNQLADCREVIIRMDCGICTTEHIPHGVKVTLRDYDIQDGHYSEYAKQDEDGVWYEESEL